MHLQDVMEKARVDKHTDAAVKIAMDLGAALVSELPEIALDIARGVGMKPLEEKRFLEHCGCDPVVRTVKAGVKFDFDDPGVGGGFPHVNGFDHSPGDEHL